MIVFVDLEMPVYRESEDGESRLVGAVVIADVVVHSLSASTGSRRPSCMRRATKGGPTTSFLTAAMAAFVNSGYGELHSS